MDTAVPVQAFIALGSNINPRKNIEEALNALSRKCTIAALSSFYLSPPLNRPEQPDFINVVAKIKTDQPPFALKYEILRKIEADAGRCRSADKYAARPIDLDILLYGDEQISGSELNIPDPDICLRPFLFVPLLELDPLLCLPGMNTPLRALCRPEADVTLKKEEEFSSYLKERFIYEH